jgi:hypothetical protein
MSKPKLPAIFHPAGGRVVLEGKEDADPSETVQRLFLSLVEEGTPQSIRQAHIFRHLVAISQLQAYVEQMAPAFLPFLPMPPLVMPRGVVIKITEALGIDIFSMDDDIYRSLADRGLMKELRRKK